MKTKIKVMRHLRVIIFITAIVSFTASSEAQKLTKAERRAKLDSMLAARYYRTPYDTNYVIRPEGKLTLKARVNQSGNSYYAEGDLYGTKAEADLSTDNKTTLSLSVSYRGLSLGVAINPEKLSGAYKDYELNVNYFSSRLSLDLSYQRSESLSGDITVGDQTAHMEAGLIRMSVVNATAYYISNHRRFSYPAAFTQSYIQRRSAGSWLAGISYQGGSLKTTDEMLRKYSDVADTRVYVGHVGIGGGYGYNLVLGKKWLFHLSALPSFVVYNRNNMEVNGVRQDAAHVRFNMLFNERAAIVHNFSSTYFAGATLVMNNSLFKDDEVTTNQNKWRVRAFFGIRL